MSETSCKRFAVCSLSSVGDRKYQEDKYSCHEQGKWRAWAVFDGHGGAFTSQWLSKHALESLLSAVSDHFSGSESIDAEKCMKTMCQTVKSWDEKLRNTVKVWVQRKKAFDINLTCVLVGWKWQHSVYSVCLRQSSCILDQRRRLEGLVGVFVDRTGL